MPYKKTIALIRARRAMHLTSPRKRLPRMLQPDMIGLEYGKALLPYVDKTERLLERYVYPYLPHILDDVGRRTDAERLDVARIGELFRKVVGEIAKMLEPKQLWFVAHHYGERTDDFQKEQFRALVRAGLGVDLSLLEPNLKGNLEDFATDNVKLIKSIPAEHVADVQASVMKGVQSGERWESLALTLEKKHGYAENRARLIGRDQVGKFYGQMNQERQKALGVTGYIWRTMHDERVRDEHAERDGEHFEWSEPPEDGHPGEAVLCRCYPEPDFSGIVEGLS